MEPSTPPIDTAPERRWQFYQVTDNVIARPYNRLYIHSQWENDLIELVERFSKSKNNDDDLTHLYNSGIPIPIVDPAVPTAIFVTLHTVEYEEFQRCTHCGGNSKICRGTSTTLIPASGFLLQPCFQQPPLVVCTRPQERSILVQNPFSEYYYLVTGVDLSITSERLRYILSQSESWKKSKSTYTARTHYGEEIKYTAQIDPTYYADRYPSLKQRYNDLAVHEQQVTLSYNRLSENYEKLHEDGRKVVEDEIREEMKEKTEQVKRALEMVFVLEGRVRDLGSQIQDSRKRKRSVIEDPCVICLEQEAKMVNLPCKHKTLCFDCMAAEMMDPAKQSKTCELCRANLNKREKVLQ